jgi:hypothetical protein
MLNAMKRIPWFEIVLIVGLAFALIAKPQTRVLSAAPSPTTAEAE